MSTCMVVHPSTSEFGDAEITTKGLLLQIQHHHTLMYQCEPHVDIYYTVPVLITTVLLKISPRIRNMYMYRIP
jgi:hypothetical protein